MVWNMGNGANVKIGKNSWMGDKEHLRLSKKLRRTLNEDDGFDMEDTKT